MTHPFHDLGLCEPLCRALDSLSFTKPTPIQAQAIPLALAHRDLLGLAQTGTGKTAAFGLPLLHHLHAQNKRQRQPRALILAPTRELAVQIHDSLKAFNTHAGLRLAVVFGGVGKGPQIKTLARGVDVLVATPGRLIDLMGEQAARLDQITHLVLDEADRMLDLGFVRDIRRIVQALPKTRQSLLFSATMPREVEHLAHEILHRPERIEVTPEVITVDRIDQQVHFVPGAAKRDKLIDLLADPGYEKVILFTRTKHGANRVAEQLEKAGVSADAIHGNKSQAARQRALARFRDGSARVLVATDIAARGIDVPQVSHVINYELPNEPESYVHRIGRTARAGRSGIAVSFCDPSEQGYLSAIERLTGRPLTVVSGTPGVPETPPHKKQRQGPRPQGAKPHGAKPGAGNGPRRPRRPDGGANARPRRKGGGDSRPQSRARA